jgi:pilus assembly protein Flp/PilA
MYLYLWLKNWLEEQEEGQGLVEYALIILLVSIVVIGVLTTLGGGVKGVFTTINATLGS